MEYVEKLQLKDVAGFTKLSCSHPFCCSLIKPQFSQSSRLSFSLWWSMGWRRANLLHFHTNDRLVCWAQTRRWWWISKAKLPSPNFLFADLETVHFEYLRNFFHWLRWNMLSESRRWFRQCRAKLSYSLLLFAHWKLEHLNIPRVVSLVEYGVVVGKHTLLSYQWSRTHVERKLIVGYGFLKLSHLSPNCCSLT